MGNLRVKVALFLVLVLMVLVYYIIVTIPFEVAEKAGWTTTDCVYTSQHLYPKTASPYDMFPERYNKYSRTFFRNQATFNCLDQLGWEVNDYQEVFR